VHQVGFSLNKCDAVRKFTHWMYT